ncbi:MAG: hypothetical protein ACI8R4_003940, partial [Paracoccaceae bacterium]
MVAFSFDPACWPLAVNQLLTGVALRKREQECNVVSQNCHSFDRSGFGGAGKPLHPGHTSV